MKKIYKDVGKHEEQQYWILAKKQEIKRPQYGTKLSKTTMSSNWIANINVCTVRLKNIDIISFLNSETGRNERILRYILNTALKNGQY